MERSAVSAGDDSGGVFDAVATGAAVGLAVAVLPVVIAGAWWIDLVASERLESLVGAMVLGAVVAGLRRGTRWRQHRRGAGGDTG